MTFLSHEHFETEFSEQFFEAFELFMDPIIQLPFGSLWSVTSPTPKEWARTVNDAQAMYLML